MPCAIHCCLLLHRSAASMLHLVQPSSIAHAVPFFSFYLRLICLYALQDYIWWALCFIGVCSLGLV